MTTVIPIQRWDLVEKVWEDGKECDGCDYCTSHSDNHGEGMIEHYNECELLERGNGDSYDCPGVDGWLEAEAEDAPDEEAA